MSIWATPAPGADLLDDARRANPCGGCNGNGGMQGQWSGWITCPDCGGTGTEQEVSPDA